MKAAEIIDRLGLVRHPEGGHYRETWAGPKVGGRASGTAIYFLLQAGETSHWHRVDADEIWHFHCGAPLELRISADRAGPAQGHVLGPDLDAGQSPQIIVPARFWQSAATTGDWTLVGCTVSPGSWFEGFELAPQDFDIT